MLIFTLVKSVVGINIGNIPYPIQVFAALLPWTFFQESASEGVNSVVSNTALIKNIHFSREIFPVTTVQPWHDLISIDVRETNYQPEVGRHLLWRPTTEAVLNQVPQSA